MFHLKSSRALLLLNFVVAFWGLCYRVVVLHWYHYLLRIWIQQTPMPSISLNFSFCFLADLLRFFCFLGRRKRGRPRKMRRGQIEDMEKLVLKENVILDRKVWKSHISFGYPRRKQISRKRRKKIRFIQETNYADDKEHQRIVLYWRSCFFIFIRTKKSGLPFQM